MTRKLIERLPDIRLAGEFGAAFATRELRQRVGGNARRLYARQAAALSARRARRCSVRRTDRILAQLEFLDLSSRGLWKFTEDN